MDYIKKVEEFHNTFGAPVLDTPQIPSKERSELRIKLMQEELDEIKEAIKNGDLTEVSDGLGDLMVVLCGSILEFGLGDKFNSIFEDIHNSNMSKACLTEDEAKETQLDYQNKGINTYYKERGGKWIVYREGDDKILKSINYRVANPGKFLN